MIMSACGRRAHHGHGGLPELRAVRGDDHPCGRPHHGLLDFGVAQVVRRDPAVGQAAAGEHRGVEAQRSDAGQCQRADHGQLARASLATGHEQPDRARWPTVPTPRAGTSA